MTLTLGRGSNVEVQIAHDSVSRRHAKLHLGRGSSIMVEDCGSANGTWVSGTRLLPEFRVPIDVGGAFAMGDVVVVVDGTTMASGASADEEENEAAPATNKMDALLATLDVVAESDLSILLLGETGVGKEVLAERAHHTSPRSKGPLVKINCASFPDQLFESELFGYERGAFTGADHRKPGLLESADGGTVFFDELGEMPLTSQAKLLRVIETKEVTRLGSTKPRAIDVRFIAATNRDLRQLVTQKLFREDLLFRLNGITLRIPPLRERLPELDRLATDLLHSAAKRLGRDPPSLTNAAIQKLRRHKFPGNVRELKAILERALVLSAASDELDAAKIDLTGGGDDDDNDDTDLDPNHPMLDLEAPPPGLTRDQQEERQRIHRVLFLECAGNQSEAARVLGIARRTLVNRLEAYQLRRPRKNRVD
jgi:two-component system, NtrC family, response regulator AtoC